MITKPFTFALAFFLATPSTESMPPPAFLATPSTESTTTLLVDRCQSVVASWVKSSAKKTISIEAANDIVHTAAFFAAENDFSTDTILAVMKVESGFDADAVSSEGARGIMQVIPRWHSRKIAGRSLFDHRVGIEVGTKVLADFRKLSGGDMKRTYTKYSGGNTVYWRRIDRVEKKLEEIKKSCKSIDMG